MEVMSNERMPLAKDSIIELNGCRIRIDDEPEQVGKGSTCLVYYGRIEEGMGLIAGTKVIVKEFYPVDQSAEFDIMREKDEEGRTGRLIVASETKEKRAYKEKWDQFMQGITAQKELSMSQAMEVAVKPWMEGAWGDSYYVVSDVHMGKDLARRSPVRLQEKLSVAICVTETMDILHSAGYVMPDFKPDNLMYIQKPKMVRILDVDSIVQYRSDRVSDQLFGNVAYASPEMKMLFMKCQDGTNPEELKRMWKKFLHPISDIYSIGIYLGKLLFGQAITEGMEEERLKNVLDTFVKGYKETNNVSQKRLRKIGEHLLIIVQKATIHNRVKRRKLGYANAAEMMRELNEVYQMLTSERLVPRKEIAKANGTFAAYNMLQKYPLFNYIVEEYGQKHIKVMLLGNHAMREEMLSAVLAIGQMLHVTLSIYLVSKDCQTFWSSYTSADKNPAVQKALIVLQDGLVMHSYDEQLVSRPLAEINLIEGESIERIKRLVRDEQVRYVVSLYEDMEKNNAVLESCSTLDEHLFVGYLKLQEEEDIVLLKRAGKDCFEISAECFSETYNEKMFEEQIYQMGLMAHAYYSGAMNEAADVDMEKLEKEFVSNMYNVASSERAALHSIYKMASLGLDKNKPGRFLNYYRKIQDPGILEQLAWLEHLSWTAYMLTTGAMPASMEEFASYAYKRGNDWKNREDALHIKHPLLVASEPQKDVLDPLEKISVQISQWYLDQKDIFTENYKNELEKYPKRTQNPEWNALEMLGYQCIKEMGETAGETVVAQWKKQLKLLADQQKDDVYWKELIGCIREVMRPVVDYYKERDYKKLDRDMVFAAIDMIV